MGKKRRKFGGRRYNARRIARQIAFLTRNGGGFNSLSIARSAGLGKDDATIQQALNKKPKPNN